MRLVAVRQMSIAVIKEADDGSRDDAVLEMAKSHPTDMGSDWG